ncbi:cellulase family glycosylhydrolase [Algoriphagus sp. D3-2-R+10]|uniref:cellulase family glycosylhydrolase n=1 Tax=Algoriphagus aurantiacus TaxID=3103948 RepID=UPI002B3E68FC|nr:cellulase family glycosylhydrolase [Algoriphagus sp. D3-2-R+10]MEB2774667.1 cellulase family glycosylhydrolase [Algoriphagus sp. D3-2-R+10]
MKHFTIRSIVFSLFIFFLPNNAFSQNKDVYVDQEGIMRWPDGKEVYGFGVNYTVPFAHAFRTAKKLGVDPREAMENDVYHFARLGFDAYRVHVWDTEISDEKGNLLENEQLDHFDYLIQLMKERDMKFLLTPIAFWGNGWPEPNENTPGFSHKYGKEGCLINPDAIEAQANYLHQFLNHVNRYTGLAYKDDPDVIAFEVSNEPHHDESAEKVTTYVTRMVDSMKSTGSEKPIFYNVSHSIHLVDAYYEAEIDGGTFQWYPTGLGAGEEIGGNLLPNVDRYTIPFKNHEGFRKGAKVVYEFDAADVGRSYIYPAMARSFRTAGIQWATHFSYDPTYMAYANTEYDTHYMNLVFAPQKALSLKIASEVFHEMPLYKNYGNYPDNPQFDDFRISYQDDLAEYVGIDKFFYTNDTKSVPQDIDQLKELAGYGNSPVVNYDGLGAYFLDQLEEGVWRLEVMPDAFWIDNLFGNNSLDKKVADVQWNQRTMSVNISDLGKSFTVHGLNEGNETSLKTGDGKFLIHPGSYLLYKDEQSGNWTAESSYKNIKIGEYYAPISTIKGTNLLHRPSTEWAEGKALKISATVISEQEIAEVSLYAFVDNRPRKFPLLDQGRSQYEVGVPGELLKNGFFKYHLVVTTQEEELTFPSGIESNPTNWDFYADQAFEVRVLPDPSAIYLFDATRDFELLNMLWSEGVNLLPSADPSKASLDINLDELPTDDGHIQPNYAFRLYFGDKVNGRKESLTNATKLVVTGLSKEDSPRGIEVSLLTKEGVSYGGTVVLGTVSGEYILDLKSLKPTDLITLPRPYPGFLSYYFEPGTTSMQFDNSEIEVLQVSISPGNKPGAKLSIKSIHIE